MKESFDPPNVSPVPEKHPKASLRRTFSKELAQNVRDETAQNLGVARNMPRNVEDLRDADPKTRPQYEPLIEERIRAMEKSVLGRLFKTAKFKESLFELDDMLARARQSRIDRVRNQYEEKFTAILRESPLGEAEQETYLNETAIVKMSLEDYLALLARLSGNFVTHVTRQGVRERGSFHDGGMGEVFDSFERVLASGKLQSFLTNFMTDPNSVPYLVDNIRKVKEQTGLSGDALVEKVLEVVEETHDQNMPADQSSVHMAANDVASYYYGAEKGYDFYFYFPAEFIAYNYFHHHKAAQHSTAEFLPGLSGDGYDWTDKHNDLGVWNEGRGVPIEAGITCIPKDVLVDRKTGSQYKLVDGKPVRKEGGEYELAEDVVTSQEYWDAYFKSHPEVKPNKILYGNFQTTPSFEGTKAYQDLFKKNVFRTSADLPGHAERGAEEFARYKVQLGDFVRGLQEENIL